MSECVTPLDTVYVWTEGDDSPPIEITVPDGGLISDFTWELELAKPDGTVEIVPITDLGGSTGNFDWGPTSLTQGFNQRAVIRRVRISDGKIKSFETLLINVKGRPGGVGG